MAEYNLGTARARIIIDASGASQVLIDTKKQFENTANGLAASGGTMIRSGAAIGAVGVGVAAGFGLAIKSAADFQSQLNGIQAVSGATGQQMEQVSKKALQLGKDTVFSAGDAALAIEELVKAGVSLPNVLNGAADATVNLAAAGKISLPEAATIASNAMNQFGLSAEVMPHVADLIAGAANASAIDVGQFGQSLQQAGAVANLMGLSFDDLSVAIAKMGNAGIKGSDAGTSLKQVLLNLVPTTKTQVEAMVKLGLVTLKSGVSSEQYADAMKGQAVAADGVSKAQQKLADLQARFKAAGDPKTELQKIERAQQLKDATDAVSKATQNQNVSASAAKDITAAGSNAFFDQTGKLKNLAGISQALNDATKNLSVEQKAAALSTIFGSDAIRGAAILADGGAASINGLAESMGKVTAADVAKKRMAGFNGALEQFKGSAETAGITIGIKFLPMLTKLLDGLTGLVNKFLELSPETQKWIEIAIGAIGVVSLLTGGFLITAGVFLKVISTISALKTAFLAFKEIAIVSSIIQKITAANTALNLSFLTNPVFLVVAAIAALALGLYALYKNNETVRKAVDSFWQSLQKGWDIVLGFGKSLINDFKRGWDVVKTTIVDFVTSALDFVKKNWDLLLPIFLGPIGAVILIWRRFGDDIKRIAGEVIQGVISFFVNLPGNIANFLVGAASAIGNFIYQLPILFATGLGAIIRFAIDGVAALIGFAVNAGTAILNFLIALPGNIATWLTNAYNFVVGWVESMVIKAIDLGSRFISNIISFFAALPGNIWNFIMDIYWKIVTWAALMTLKAIDMGTQFVNNVVNFFQQLPGKVLGFLIGVYNTVTQKASEISNKALEMGRNFFNNLIDGIQGLPKKIEDIVQNAINALTNKVNDAGDAAKRLGGKMWDGFKQGLGISSPSFIEKAMFALNDNMDKETDKLANHILNVQKVGETLATPININTVGTAGGANSGVVINLDFTGMSIADAQQIENVLSSSSVLTQLTQAAKAGRR